MAPITRPLPVVACAEMLGTYCLVVVGAGVVCADAYALGGIGLAGIALAHGLALVGVVVALEGISGAHVNPAVTFALLVSRRMRPALAGVYVTSQLIGAALAGLTLLAFFGVSGTHAIALGTPMPGVNVVPGTAVGIEAVLTGVFVAVVLLVSVERGNRERPRGLAIGATLASVVVVGGPLTGGAVNPARAFGPAFASGTWEAHYVYWIGPAIGAAVAAAIFSALRDRSFSLGEQSFIDELEARDNAIEEAERLLAARSKLRVVDDPEEESDGD